MSTTYCMRLSARLGGEGIEFLEHNRLSEGLLGHGNLLSTLHRASLQQHVDRSGRTVRMCGC